jgi:lipoate-protein ligase A
MFDTWRVLLDDKITESRLNLAYDEALARIGEPLPTLRLWRNDPCVVVGRSQVAAAEVDSRACRALGVPVYRRFTVGGAVYHDRGNLNVSLILSLSDPLLACRPDRRHLPGMYRIVLDPVVAALRALGCDARVGGRGIMVHDSKLSGVAAWTSARRLMVHATLLVDADLEALARVLEGPGAHGDARWERTRSHKSPVTSLARIVRDRGDLRDLGGRVVSAFAEYDGHEADSAGRARRDFRIGSITPRENTTAVELFASRYSRPVWHASGLDGEAIY